MKFINNGYIKTSDGAIIKFESIASFEPIETGDHKWCIQVVYDNGYITNIEEDLDKGECDELMHSIESYIQAHG